MAVKYLPSPRFLGIVLPLAAAFITAGVLFAREEGAGDAKLEVVLTAADPAVRAAPGEHADADADGLKDWEEALRGTDPKRADTDADGTKDGDEVAEERNPLKPGPDDDALAAASSSAALPRTSTGSLALEFFSRYLTLKKTGMPLSDQMKGGLVDSVLARASAPGAPAYSAADLSLGRAETPTGFRAYGNEAGGIIAAFATDTEDPVLLLQGLKDRDEARLARLQSTAEAYRAIAETLVGVQVPASAGANHLALANAFAALGHDYAAMLGFETDPLSSIAAMASYPGHLEALSQAAAGIQAAFEARGVAFSRFEEGGWFSQFSDAIAQ